MTSYRVEQITGASAVEQNLLEELLNTEQCRRKDRKIWGLKDYLKSFEGKGFVSENGTFLGGGGMKPPLPPSSAGPSEAAADQNWTT